MNKIAFVAGLTALFPLAALAHEGVHVQDAYARSSNPMTGAIFMELDNHGAADCTLRAASSDAAERVELHTHLEQDGVMRMRKVEGGFPVAAGQSRHLDRGGDHVMLLGLTQPLADGDVLSLSLDFGDCGMQQLEVVVDNQRTTGGQGHDHGHSAAADEHAGH